MVFDDTCYFVPCRTQEEASLVAECLDSDAARSFYSAFIFWDAKRPITVDVLARLDISRLARELRREAELTEARGELGVETEPAPVGTLWAV